MSGFCSDQTAGEVLTDVTSTELNVSVWTIRSFFSFYFTLNSSFRYIHISREKYLNTLLQVEVMLKLWFPQISIQPVSTAFSVAASPAHSLQETSTSTPPHKHRDQLHIPVKVRKPLCCCW